MNDDDAAFTPDAEDDRQDIPATSFWCLKTSVKAADDDVCHEDRVGLAASI